MNTMRAMFVAAAALAVLLAVQPAEAQQPVELKGTAEINDTTSNGPSLTDGDEFGTWVADIGDLDNDGIPDIAAGAPSDDAGGTDSGAIHIMFMNRDGSIKSTVEINNSTTNGPDLENFDRFGSVAGIGDLDNDGIPDIAAGAPSDDAGGTDSGAIHIMFMNRDGTPKSTAEINDSTSNGPSLGQSDQFGISVANIGDLNNDGIPDIMVGAHRDDAGGTDRGAIHIMFMNRDGTPKSTVEINDSTANGPNLSNLDYFGISAANIGDLNNDGIPDIAVGAYGSNDGGTDRGSVHIIFMNRNGTPQSTVKINDSTASGPTLANADQFGVSVANIGDLNNDGIPDIAVGAFLDDTGAGNDRGAVHILFMNRDGSLQSSIAINDSTANGPNLAAEDRLGSSVAGVGDLNRDGIPDILAGAHRDDGGSSDRGALHILYPYVSRIALTAAGSIVDSGNLELDGAAGVAVTEISGTPYAVVASSADDGVQMVDISNPSSLQAAGYLNDDGSLELDGANNVAITVGTTGGPFAIVTGYADNGVQSINLSDPSSISGVSNFVDDTNDPHAGPHDVDTIIYNGVPIAVVAHRGDNTASASQLGSGATFSNARGTASDQGSLELDDPTGIAAMRIGNGDYAAVASYNDNGLQMLQIGGASLAARGYMNDDNDLLLRGAHDVALTVINNKAYAVVASWEDDGIQIVDVSDPANLAAAGKLADNSTLELDTAAGVAVATINSIPYAVVAANSDNGVQVIDISDPNYPHPAGHITDTNQLILDGARGVAIAEVSGKTYAIIASVDEDGIQLIEMAPHSPIPTITSSAGASGTSTSASPVRFTINFDKEVSGFESSDITVGGGSNPGPVTGFTGSGSGPYVFTVTPTGDGSITVQVPASVTTPANAASELFTLVYAAPAIPTILSSDGTNGGTTMTTPVNFSISFDKSVTGFISSDIMLGGTAGGSISGFGGTSAGPYTFTVTPANTGTISIAVPAGVTVPTNAASSVFTIRYATDPVPTITSDLGPSTGVSPVPFSVSFDSPVSGFSASDITVSGDANPGPVTGFSGSGTGPYTFSVIPANNGIITVDIAAGSTVPSNVAATTYSISYAYVPPAIAISSDAGPDGSATADTRISFSVSFDRMVSGFTSSDITLSGTAGGSISGFAGSGAGPYTFTISPDNAGSIVIEVPAGVTEPPNAAATFTITHQRVLFGTAGQVLDNSDVGLWNANSVTIYEASGKTYAAFTALIDGGIQILDISDPYRPLALGWFAPADNSLAVSHISAVAEIGSKIYAAVGNLQGKFQMVDITDPNIPVGSGELVYPDPALSGSILDIQTIKIGSKTYAAAASGSSALLLVDISNPENPTLVGHLSDTGSTALKSPDRIEFYKASGRTYAAVSNSDNNNAEDGIQIVDVTDPSNPAPAGSLTDNASLVLDAPSGLAIYTIQGGTYAILASTGENGIQIIDITDPNNPVARGSLTDSADLKLDDARAVSAIHLDGRTYAIVAGQPEDGIQIVDISDPDNPYGVYNIANDAHLLLDSPFHLSVAEIDGVPYAVIASSIDNAAQLLRIYTPSDAQDWSATLTARDHSGSSHGCTDEMVSSNPSISCKHMITEPVFLLDGTAHRVSQVFVDRAADTFNFVTEPPATAELGNYHLSVGTSQFNLACGKYSDDPCRTAWSSVSKFLLWSDGRMVPMSFDRKNIVQPIPDRPAGWHPTLHVQDLGNGRLGCDNNIAGMECSRFLNPDTLEINGHTHSITTIYTDSDSLHITITGPDADSLAGQTLHINTQRFVIGPPVYTGEYAWHGLDRETVQNSGTPHPDVPHILSWRVGANVQLGLSGTPTPPPAPERPLVPRQVTWQTDWSPALTVHDLGNGRLGCDDSSTIPAAQCGNAITAPTFELQGTTYTISQISLEKALVYHGGNANGRLIINISPAPAYDVFRSYSLHVEALELGFGPGSGDSAKTDWIGVGKALKHWSDGTRANLSISSR